MFLPKGGLRNTPGRPPSCFSLNASQVRALVYYHTEAFTSGQDLLQAAHDDPFVDALMVPATGLGESTFYEANATRGSQQLLELVDRLAKKVGKRLPLPPLAVGELVAIDGSLIEASLSCTGLSIVPPSLKPRPT